MVTTLYSAIKMGFLDKIDNVSGSNVYLVYLCCLVASMRVTTLCIWSTEHSWWSHYERHVMLLLDEIYVEPKATYKCGSVTGMASYVPSEQASTVQTFVVCSLLSTNKDVAVMVPVKTWLLGNWKSALWKWLECWRKHIIINCNHYKDVRNQKSL